MARNTVGPRADEQWPTPDYQANYEPTAYGAPDFSRQAAAPDHAAPSGRAAAPSRAAAANNRAGTASKAKPAAGHGLQRRQAKSRVDEWMEVDFKFGGSRIKRKAVALLLLGLPAVAPLFFMLPALLTLNSNTFAVSVDDTLGNGAQMCLFLCLLVTPLVTITGQHWFVPLRRWPPS
jgi:hypothetical protein